MSVKPFRLLALHSPRSGNGVSTIAVNLAALLAAQGGRVCLADLNLASPSLLHLTNAEAQLGVQDFLMGNCVLAEALLELSPARFSGGAGRFALLPARMSLNAAARFAKDGAYFASFYNELKDLLPQGFDFAVLDLPSGLSEGVLSVFSALDVLLEVSNPHVPSFQDFALILAIAQSLEIPQTLAIINLALPKYDARQIAAEYERAFGIEAAANLQMNLDVVDFPNRSFFALARPDDPYARELARLASRL